MSDLAQRLRQLGVTKGTGELASPRQTARSGVRADEALPPGQQIETPFGVCFFIEERYPPQHIHGRAPLSGLLAHDRTAAAQMSTFAEEPGATELPSLDLSQALFIDTETTGLGQGAGVLAFLIGVGYFEDGAFVLRQYFLRDPAEETAALNHLAEWSETFTGLVSFNGRGFDVPLLRSRCVLSRLSPAILDKPHLDLLPPSRRIWRGRFESCALGSLERNVLGVQRSQDDIMSWLIPDLYRQYLRGGDNGEMRQVLYHNAVDILSLVILAEQLCRLFANSLAEDIDPRERVALARWFEALDLPEQAEATYRVALEGWLPIHAQHLALQRLAALLKKQERRPEAVPLWVQWAMEDEGSVEAYIELAKYYEWHTQELDKALAWTQQALTVVAKWPSGPRRDEARSDLDHRRTRLEAKTTNAQSG
jgi:uncharacterized protein YprB with RNaseH-like and TPR domain